MGEDFCVHCGLVLNSLIIEEGYTPFGDDEQEENPSNHPSNQLALGRNLGTEMSPHDLWSILQKRSSRDVPFRFNVMRKIVFDRPTILKQMLIHASQLCKVYDLGSNVEFSNHYGTLLRRVSKFVQEKRDCRVITSALFIIIWSEMYQNNEKSKQIMLDLGVTSSVFKEVLGHIEKSRLGTQSSLLGTQTQCRYLK
jgi:hypothetical protein